MLGKHFSVVKIPFGVKLCLEVFFFFPVFSLSINVYDTQVWLPDLCFYLLSFLGILFSVLKFFEIYLLIYHPLVHWVLFHCSHDFINLLVQIGMVGYRERRERKTDSIWEQPWWSKKRWDLWTMKDKNSKKSDIHDLALC